jgi:hypothetical protein
MTARHVIPVSMLAFAVTAVIALVSLDTDARGGARGGGGGARTSINSAGGGARAASGGTRSTAGNAGANRSGSAAANRGNNTSGRDVNRDTSRSTERNTNIERNTNVDIDVDDDGWFGEHPIAGMAAIGTAAAVTAAAIGSVVYAVPPSCVTSVVNGMTYQQCGGTWYEPQYVGTTVQYVVVNPPQ